MNYEALAQDALRGVVKAALKVAAGARQDPAGTHHFYITFKTEAPGVSGPVEVLSKYPDEMTIVLQHQYWDLAPGETFFTVTLKFGGSAQAAVGALRGGDPLLRSVRPVPAAVRRPRPAWSRPSRAPPARGRAGADADPTTAAKVVSLDQFRKK